MEPDVRLNHIKAFITHECIPLLEKKGNDYTNAISPVPDANANFKWVAEQLGLAPLRVWAVYYLKHHCALMAWLKSGKLQSEPITSRIADMVNYLLILDTLIKEAREIENK